MRVVRNESELAKMFELATSEATAAFGDGSMFVEKFIGRVLFLQKHSYPRGFSKTSSQTFFCYSNN